jgi:cation:H+ antiporter
MAFGNIVGSNIANVGLLLGLTALLRPLVVHSTLVTREIPMMILASVAMTVLFLDGPFQGGREEGLQLGDGLVLLLLFGVFLYYTAADVLRSRDAKDSLVTEAGEHSMADKHPAMLWMVLLILGGAGGLAFGGDMVVGAATSLARALGIGDVVIAATVVAVGTSLPELATSVIAARKGESDLAIGNIVGSNLFNILFVMGTTALLAPVPLPAGGGIDLAIMVGLAALVLPLALTDGSRITRWEGGLLLLVYAGFTAWQLMRPV